MAVYKTIDIYSTVGGAVLTDRHGFNLSVNTLTSAIVRGDYLILRWHLYQTQYSNAAFAIPDGAGLECIVTSAFQVKKGSTIMAYADDTMFKASLWTDYDRSQGKVACELITNTTNLINDIGTEADKNYWCALVMTPPGGS